MTGSTNYGQDRTGGEQSIARRRSVRDRLRALSRYDLLLTVIPLAFAFAVLASEVVGVSLRGAMAVGSTLGALAVFDALFVHPPVDREDGGPDPGRRRS